MNTDAEVNRGHNSRLVPRTPLLAFEFTISIILISLRTSPHYLTWHVIQTSLKMASLRDGSHSLYGTLVFTRVLVSGKPSQFHRDFIVSCMETGTDWECLLMKLLVKFPLKIQRKMFISHMSSYGFHR
jgi:hypothetical protein